MHTTPEQQGFGYPCEQKVSTHIISGQYVQSLLGLIGLLSTDVQLHQYTTSFGATTVQCGGGVFQGLVFDKIDMYNKLDTLA